MNMKKLVLSAFALLGMGSVATVSFAAWSTPCRLSGSSLDCRDAPPNVPTKLEVVAGQNAFTCSAGTAASEDGDSSEPNAVLAANCSCCGGGCSVLCCDGPPISVLKHLSLADHSFDCR